MLIVRPLILRTWAAPSLNDISGLIAPGSEPDAASEDCTTGIALAPPRPGDPTGVQTGISLTTDDIDATHAELKASGVDVDAEVSRMGEPVPPMFWFRDPDGNTLLIVELS